MNKNIIKLFAIVMMIFMIGAVLVACGGAQGEQGEQGIQGEPGVQGEKGEQGVAGVTPHIGPNGNWWIGDQDTGVCPKGEDLRDCENHDYWNEEIEEYNKVVFAAHTQTSLGLTIWNCVDCGDTYFEWVDHEYTIVTETVAPTCTEEGYTLYHCACGLEELDANGEAVKRDIVAAKGHVKGQPEYVKNEAGVCECIWDNAWFINCSVCGVKLDEGKDGATGHSYTKYEPVKPEAGVNPCTWCEDTVRAKCDNCDCHEDVIPGSQPRGHKEQEYTSVVVNGNDVTLSYVCDDCGETVEKKFTIAEGVEGVEIDEAAATCTKAGHKKVTYTYTVDEAEKTIVLVDETEAIKAHTEETITGKLPTCDEAGLSDGKKCSVCGTVTVEQKPVAATGHNHGEGINGATRPNIVIEIGGTKYDAYWCEVCVHWIAYQEHK